ncbi:MAG: 3-octaprenyl-4-hydroxybenzoate carboxy-lyase [Bacteroidetes bacterium HGW-Bacteroidetes-8]|jgi:4-hydroxy-3-polyprenylbenzoate decarboxylase|nr:MAG: 3-octaprenyl-4-hydroxybenzoate carboxy-lyase [Bacteroidetes bacterium HGW-Bacteroidetes-8]
MEKKKSKKILLGVTGASGQIYALKVLQIIQQLQDRLSGAGARQATLQGDALQTALQAEYLRNENIQIEIVFTDTAKIVWEDELGQPVPGGALDNNSYYHPFASGSNAADVMIILPATMGTIGRIASGATADLLTRAADVMLKERRPLIICPRETPFNLIHLRNLTTLAQAGALIAPASPSFYTHPKDLDALTETFARRIINLAGVDVDLPKFL